MGSLAILVWLLSSDAIMRLGQIGGFTFAWVNGMKLPFSKEEFYDPARVVRRLGLQLALSTYRNEVEPLYRQDGLPGLPRDWRWRTLYIHTLAKGRCRMCRKPVPDSTAPHHKVFRRNGGDHSIQNLILLCNRCHRLQHPEYD